MCHAYSTDRSEVWVFPRTNVAFSLPGAAGTAKRYASHKIWPAARKPQKSPRWARKNVEKYFLGKSAIFQSLIRETAKWHGVLHIRAHLVAKGVLGHMRQIHPISTCTEGKSANFSKYGFSPEPTLDYVQIVPRIPLGTSRTPQGHQPCIFR